MKDAIGAALGFFFGVSLAIIVGTWITVLPALGLLWLTGAVE